MAIAGLYSVFDGFDIARIIYVQITESEVDNNLSVWPEPTFLFLRCVVSSCFVYNSCHVCFRLFGNDKIRIFFLIFHYLRDVLNALSSHGRAV